MGLNVSFDGLRKNLTRSYNDFTKSLKENNLYGENIFTNLDDDQLKDLNYIRSFIGAVNCCYQDDDDSDFNDLYELPLEDVYDEDNEP